ncbi:carboxylate-amine ligase [Angustibacter luteus]|uniref:Putative glutamate--cysteine ligase 2 n=1 Tax=Angustibacter luteus TaxID=658456 RepID=A0ABW1JF58_9ACTN
MRTVGVEEELLVVDPETGQALALAAAVVALDGRDDGAGAPGGTLEGELQLQQVEVDTHPQTDLSALADDVVAARARAAEAAGRVGAQIAALATSPLPTTPRTTPAARYLTMAERFGLTESEQLTCGLHVHVGVESDDEGVAALDRIRVWLPTLIALSVNSPFWSGVDSGYGSFRSQLWNRWPTAGPLELLGSADAYHRLVAEHLATDVPLDAGMLYFDARLSAQYPTVEVRVADVCLLAQDTVLVAALCRALVETAVRDWRDGRPPDDVPTALLRLASWRAGRSGLDENLVDPGTWRPRRASEVVASLVEHVRPALADSGDLDEVQDGVADLLHRGPGAVRQRTVLHRGALSGDVTMADVVRDAVEQTARPV